MLRKLAAFVLGISLASLAFADADFVTVKKTLFAAQAEDTFGVPLPLECPPGYEVTVATVHRNFPTANPSGSSAITISFDAPDASGHIVGATFQFALPVVGWTSVDLYLTCVKIKADPPPNQVVEVQATAPPGATAVGGAAICPPGLTALGGQATFANGQGQVLEETANVNIADPFNLNPQNGAPILWDAFGVCSVPSCTIIIKGVCGSQLDSTLLLGKRKPIDAVDAGAPSTTVIAKVAVAAGAVGTVSVTCPAGKVSTAGGYVAANSLNTSLVNLEPNTTGTPYALRPDGTYEAPNGWTLTMRNTGNSPNQIGVTAICVTATSSSTTVVEFYNASLDHYFITWVADEIAKLDAGTVIRGWTRTGQALKTYTTPQSGTSPVCRYYIPPGLGDSHFFGRGTAECNATGTNNPSFVLEDPAFMQMFLPNLGVCPTNTTNVYRVFSNRPDANHRYMTDKAVRDQMVARGWLAEGDGPDLVVMCAPQ